MTGVMLPIKQTQLHSVLLSFLLLWQLILSRNIEHYNISCGCYFTKLYCHLPFISHVFSESWLIYTIRFRRFIQRFLPNYVESHCRPFPVIL